MLRECPGCHREFEMETEFCPACGAPMNPDAHRIRQEHEAANSAALPMKWYKFLLWVSLPLGMLLLGYNLFQTVRALAGFDPAQFRDGLAGLARLILYLDMGVQGILAPLFIYTEVALARMQWRGVRVLLGIYLFQFAYALVTLVLLLQIPENVTQIIIAACEMLALFFLNRVYFKKRKPRFS